MAELRASQFENVVEYKIFCLPSTGEENETKMNIEDTLYDVLSYAHSLMGDYIWQKDCFNLQLQELEKPKEMKDSEQLQFLKGSTNFDDNIDDEWFIVYILFCITRKFPHFIATVNDNDGEFLLIEAAEYLPKWLEPDTSENRVFIFEGNLHIIPLPQKPSDITVFPAGKLSVYQAVKILKENCSKTVALPWIQGPIMKRIQEYPEKARNCFHNVLCYVPADVKFLLEKKNSLISSAVLAFVNREPLHMNMYQKRVHFCFKSLVPCRVHFTKCLYSQLVKQNFIPDKDAMKYLPEVSSPRYKGHLIGLQLTYGFELMYNQQSGYINGVPAPSSQSDQQWEKYLQCLTKYGYFRNEVVGSQLYTELLENAKDYFTSICLDSQQSQNYSNEIKKLLENRPELDESLAKLQPVEFPPDDDESWLEVSSDKLESMLSQYCQTGLSTGDHVDLRDIVSGMNSFVETVSSYEGAEFPSALGEDEEIQFDAEEFMKSFDKFFRKPTNKNVIETTSDDNSSSNSNASDDEQIIEYTSAMDKELSATNVGKSFVKLQEKSEDLQACSKDEIPAKTETCEDEENVMKPVDIDLNLVQNFLESYSLQEGLPGPVSNILSSMGITLPENLLQTDS